jgi:hypothetical protein
LTDIIAKLDAIEAGLEGVTPGPWDRGRLLLPGSPWRVGQPRHTVAEVRVNANAAHIARLDPDTVREMTRLARIGAETEARRTALDEMVKLSQELKL